MIVVVIAVLLVAVFVVVVTVVVVVVSCSRAAAAFSDLVRFAMMSCKLFQSDMKSLKEEKICMKDRSLSVCQWGLNMF